MKNPFRKKTLTPREVFIRTFLDCIAPGVVKFEVDHYIFGNTYRCVWALREYPASTESQAILRHLGEKSGVTLRIYCRQVSPGEEDRIIDNANKKNKLDGSDPNKLRQAVEAESNLRDVAELVHKMHREHEPLLHCAVYLEMTADSMEHLRQLQTDVLTELVRCKLNVDKLLLRQKQGFYCASPVGYNALGREFERVLPAGSVANLYPFNYSGKTDPNGFYIGKDKYGSNIVVDFDRRDSDKTSANILILGNSGQGKSYLMKLLICNLLEAGKSVVSLDAEHELEELCDKLGGCFIDLMAGEKRINVLEVRCWNEDTEADESAPGAFRKSTLLARHISFLKDFFRAYKEFSDPQLDTIEIMLSKLYQKWGISEETDFRQLKPEDYPILSDLYALINDELVNYRKGSLYTRELLQEVLLGLHSLCVGADAPFFNGHTNISDDRFLVFGVGGVLTAARSLRNALLFNVLAYMSDRLLTAGNTVAALDELYLWLSNPVAIEYIRNCLKRVRKRDSALMMASQNLEDFDQEGVREMTKPLFAIPPHQFLFNPGSIDRRFYMDMLQLDEAEFELIRRARRGECLFKCGAERYHLKVIAPDHIPQDWFERVQRLFKSREKTVSVEKTPFHGRIQCSCGAACRSKRSTSARYWLCMRHDGDEAACPITQIPETQIQQAFLRLYYNLKHQGSCILPDLIANLRSIRERKFLWSVDVIELNRQIAELTSQNQLLTTLRESGCVDPDIFISKSNKLTEQLRAVKQAKSRILNQDGDDTIPCTQELITILKRGPETLHDFDGELFGQLIDKVIIESNTSLRFRLKNGLELRESIERTVR